ncbi:Regulator of G-protein signaling 7 [Phlyctochytrium planicorne]|nr:Regulator of G-protein signaling 7 [Phlyctochytrium planicorne]
MEKGRNGSGVADEASGLAQSASVASDGGIGGSQHSLVGDLNGLTDNSLVLGRVKKRASMTNSHFQKIIPTPLTDPSVATPDVGNIDADDDGGEGNSSPIPSRPNMAKRKVDARRLAMYEDVVLRLREPGTGLDLKDRSRMFKAYPQTFLGSELVDWLITNCNLLSKEEGTRFATNLFEAGYVISVDLLEKFSPDSSTYVFQTSYFWPSIRFAPTDKDYLAYLLRRNQRTTAKYQLTDVEDRRLMKLKKKFRKQRDEIETIVKEQNDHIDLLSKSERRLFSLQEFSFWRQQRPLDSQTNSLPTKDEAALEKRSQTEAQYEAKLTDPERLVFWERKREIYEASLSLNRVRVSAAVRALLQRCEIMKAFDPFVNSSVTNPFITDDTKIWDVVRNAPSKHDLLLWCHSFQDLLRDPLGVKVFMGFLETEFSTENLEFHLRVEALATLPTYQEYLAEAEAIFDEFIQVGSPRELNITSGTRSSLLQQFAIVKGNAIQKSQTASTISGMNVPGGMPSIIVPPLPNSQKEIAATTPTPATALPISPSASSNFSGIATANTSSSTLPQSASIHSAMGHGGYRRHHGQIGTSNRLSNFVFKDAQEHILMLMAKDSYVRFLGSDVLQSLLAKEGIDQETLASTGLGAVKGNMSRRNLVSSS